MLVATRRGAQRAGRAADRASPVAPGVDPRLGRRPLRAGADDRAARRSTNGCSVPPGRRPYSGTWFLHAANSAYRVIAGFLIAAVFGVVLGSLIGWFRLVSDLLDPVIQVLRPIPITAWVPFAVIFFGIRDGSAFFLIALGAFFPIVVNTAAGVAGTPKLLVRAARMLGIRRHMLLPRVVLPSAMPFIFTGLRLGIGLAWVLVIVAEMLAVKSGLGFAMWDAYYFLRMDVIIAAMLSVGVLGFLSDLAIRLIGRWVLRWSHGL